MSLHLWEETAALFQDVDLPHSDLLNLRREDLRGDVEAGHKALSAALGTEPPLHPAVVAPLPQIEGGWPVIMADPPWNFRSWVANANPTSSRAAERHYRTMKLEEIMAMPVKQIAAKDAHLMLWITMPFLAAGVHVPLMKAWGFKPSSSAFVWMKLKRKAGVQYELITIGELNRFLHIGMGHTTRKNVEVCLLGRRGNARRVSKAVLEPIITPVREHSRKPDEAYERAMEYAAGPYLELFSREEREGWTTWGNETGKF
ncbi:MAG: MT-A70 family methyltransferase [Pseudomonadota bacterium]